MKSILFLTVMWLMGASSTDLNVTVAQDGTGDFKTIMEAVLAAPEMTSPSRFTIFIKAGTYNEYVTVDAKKVNLTFVGEGRETTIISGNRRHTEGGLHTYQTATVTILGYGFVAQDITFENVATESQAVALSSESDRSIFFRCNITGFQDTLLTRMNRQFYRECDIYGTVDFIFGNAAAVFQNCNIYARNSSSNIVTVTAQGREQPSEKTGTVFHNCTITAGADLGSMTKVYMGRPWRNNSRVVVMQSYIDKIVDPSGWMEWTGEPQYLVTLYYAEYGNRGAGAVTTGRVKWPGYQGVISMGNVTMFTVRNFLQGDTWIPSTGIPCNLDLI